MNKRLTAKVQKINPKLQDQTNNISNCMVINPDDDTMLEKKGVAYVAFDISGRNQLDSLLVTKVVNDVLHDSYFQSESASPIQSVEKAILKLRDSITNISESEGEPDINLVFNIATAILWGNTLYLVQYGSTKIFLMRDGNVKPIESATEGRFSVASGVVKDNDVVILATNNFSEKFPPDKLISSADISNDSLDALESSLILKFSVVKEFSKDEVVDFGQNTPDTKMSQPIEKGAESKGHRKQKEITKDSKTTTTILKTGRTGESKRPKWLIIAGIGLVLFVVFAVGNALFGSPSNAPDEENGNGGQEEQISEDVSGDTKVAVPPDTKADDSGIQRVDSNVFYDIKITDGDVMASELVVIGNKIFSNDSGGGKLYVSNIDAPKFTVVETSFLGIRNLTNHDGNLGFVDSKGYKVLDIDTYEILESYSAQELGPTTTYTDFIYSVSENKITKYTKEDGALEASLWTQNAVLESANSIGIDVNIYVLKPNGELLRFTTGTQDEFGIKGLETALNNPIKLLVDVDLENIYIADSGNNRVVVLDKEGVFVTQYKVSGETEWDDMRGIGISLDETRAFVLNGSKVYEFSLASPE